MPPFICDFDRFKTYRFLLEKFSVFAFKSKTKIKKNKKFNRLRNFRSYREERNGTVVRKSANCGLNCLPVNDVRLGNLITAALCTK